MNTTAKQAREILLIDDDPLVVKVYAERMRYEGWSVSVARDGWEACQEAGRSRYDMILLDIRMPFHDGCEVLKEIREGGLNSESLVYILTSLSESDEVDDAVRLGADGVFRKAEVRPDELVERIEEILSGKKVDVKAVGAAIESSGDLDFSEYSSAAVAEEAQEEAPAEASKSSLSGHYVVYVNPLLGDGAKLSGDLGLPAPFTCHICGGQVSLVLAAGEGHELKGLFACGECNVEV